MSEAADIVELLRGEKWSTGVTINQHAEAAAREIERLRDLLERADARLREHGDTTTHPVRVAIYEATRTR